MQEKVNQSNSLRSWLAGGEQVRWGWGGMETGRMGSRLSNSLPPPELALPEPWPAFFQGLI